MGSILDFWQIQGDSYDRTTDSLHAIAASIGGSGYSDNDFVGSGSHNFTSAYPLFTIQKDTRFNLTGISVDISAFHVGALITLQVQRATNTLGTDYKDYRDPIFVVSGTDPDLVNVPDIKGMYSYTRVTALSNNAGDNNVNVPLMYVTRDIE